MAKTRILIVPAFFVLLACAPLPGEQENESSPKKQISEAEIKKLIADLGDVNYRVREKASKELGDIGLPALEQLEKAEESSELETRQRAKTLAQAIRVANRLPTRVNGMEFKLVMDKKTEITPALTEVHVKGALHITNTREAVYRIYLDNAVKGFLHNAEGQSIVAKGSNLSLLHRPDAKFAKLEPSPPLKKSESFIFQFYELVREAQGGDNPVWGFGRAAFGSSGKSRVPNGVYSFGIIYENNVEAGPKEVPFWMGRAETVTETLTVK